MAGKEPGGLNDSLEVHLTLKGWGHATLSCKGTLSVTVPAMFNMAHHPFLGKRATSPYIAFSTSKESRQGTTLRGTSVTTQAELGEMTLVGGSTIARTGPHIFSCPCAWFWSLSAPVSSSCASQLQGNRSTQFLRTETCISPSAPWVAAAAYGSCHPSCTGKIQWREEAQIPCRFRKEIVSCPGEQNVSPSASDGNPSWRKHNLQCYHRFHCLQHLLISH